MLSALQSLPISEITAARLSQAVCEVRHRGCRRHDDTPHDSQRFELGFHFPDALANAIGFLAAVLQNYLLNYRWTLGDRRYTTTKARWVQISQFATVSIVGLGINTIVREVVSHLMYPFWQSIVHNPVAEVVNYNFSIAVAIGVVLFGTSSSTDSGRSAVLVKLTLAWPLSPSTIRRPFANRQALVA